MYFLSEILLKFVFVVHGEILLEIEPLALSEADRVWLLR